MNSKQRRQTNRAFPHEVTIRTERFERYYLFDEHCMKARGWLQWKTKRKNYTTSGQNVYGVTFKFRDPAMATMFALKWCV